MEVKVFSGTIEEIKSALENEEYSLSAKFFAVGNSVMMVKDKVEAPQVEPEVE